MSITREIVRKLYNEGEAVITVDGARWTLYAELYGVDIETPADVITITHPAELSDMRDGCAVTMED